MQRCDESAEGLEAENNMEFPTYVEVLRDDRLGGLSVYIILNPATKEVTHIVVKQKARLCLERLIDLGIYDRLVQENILALTRLN
jgi:hypothetical protein